MQPDDRLYVELIPDDKACEYLRDLVDYIKPYIKGRPVDPTKWHLTILHFGIADHVFYDLQRVLPNISRTVYAEALDGYIERAKKSLPPPTKLPTSTLELFGIKENVLVLNLEPSETIENVHTNALANLTMFLNDCGVVDPQEFIQNSINFKWALELRPHITLFRGVVSFKNEQIKIRPAKLNFNQSNLHGL